MDFISHLIKAAEAFRLASGLERTTVSWRMFGDSKKLDAIIGGSDIQVRRYESAMSWLSANWPNGAEWPLGVGRPHVVASSPDEVVPPNPSHGAENSDVNITRTESGA